MVTFFKRKISWFFFSLLSKFLFGWGKIQNRRGLRFDCLQKVETFSSLIFVSVVYFFSTRNWQRWWSSSIKLSIPFVVNEAPSFSFFFIVDDDGPFTLLLYPKKNPMMAEAPTNETTMIIAATNMIYCSITRAAKRFFFLFPHLMTAPLFLLAVTQMFLIRICNNIVVFLSSDHVCVYVDVVFAKNHFFPSSFFFSPSFSFCHRFFSHQLFLACGFIDLSSSSGPEGRWNIVFCSCMCVWNCVKKKRCEMI